jgi:hypothetical protein
MEKPSEHFDYLVAATAKGNPSAVGHQIIQGATLALIDQVWEQYQLERAELNRQLDDLRQQLRALRCAGLPEGVEVSDGKAE